MLFTHANTESFTAELLKMRPGGAADKGIRARSDGAETSRAAAWCWPSEGRYARGSADRYTMEDPSSREFEATDWLVI